MTEKREPALQAPPNETGMLITPPVAVSVSELDSVPFADCHVPPGVVATCVPLISKLKANATLDDGVTELKGLTITLPMA